GTKVNISGSSMLTSAEVVALVQVGEGGQTLTLSAAGVATAGTVGIGRENAVQAFTTIVVPAGLTLSDNATGLSLSPQSLVNYGTLQGSNLTISSAGITNQGTISALGG